METLVLEEEQQIKAPELKTFRTYVDNTCKYWKKRDEIFIKLMYITAARASELLTCVTPWQLKNNKTKPYGNLLKWELTDYRWNGKVIKILLIKCAVAKRKKTVQDQNKMMFLKDPTQPQASEETGQQQSAETDPSAREYDDGGKIFRKPKDYVD